MDICSENKNQVCLHLKYSNGQQTKIIIFDANVYIKKCEITKLKLLRPVSYAVDAEIYCDNKENSTQRLTLGIIKNDEPKKIPIKIKSSTIFSRLFSKKETTDIYPKRGYFLEFSKVGGRNIYLKSGRIEFYIIDSGSEKKLDEKYVMLDFDSNLREYNFVERIDSFLKPLSDKEKQKLINALKQVNEEDIILEQQEKNKGFLRRLFGY